LRTWLAEHQPRGVLPEFAARVLHAQRLVVHEPRSVAGSTRENSGRIEVRSLAVSAELAELLRNATERLERPAAAATTPEPAPSDLELMSNDPELHRVARRFFRDIVVVTAALIIALFYARTRVSPDGGGGALARGKPPSAARKHAAKPASDAGAPTRALQPEAVLPSTAAEQPPPAREPTGEATREAPERAPAAEAEAHGKRGALSVSAVPWAEVRIDGRLLGTTPRRSMPVRAGKHVVSLSCPPLAHSVQVPIELSSGQELHVSANMHESPPQVNVR
jgi:hypothetical protein